jgi:hypothetical protein
MAGPANPILSVRWRMTVAKDIRTESISSRLLGAEFIPYEQLADGVAREGLAGLQHAGCVKG